MEKTIIIPIIKNTIFFLLLDNVFLSDFTIKGMDAIINPRNKEFISYMFFSNIEVINNFLKENDNFELVPIDEVNVDLDNQEKGYLKIYPNIHGMDGFFIAKLKRVR